jgi:hypothetical protein
MKLICRKKGSDVTNFTNGKEYEVLSMQGNIALIHDDIPLERCVLIGSPSAHLVRQIPGTNKQEVVGCFELVEEKPMTDWELQMEQTDVLTQLQNYTSHIKKLLRELEDMEYVMSTAKFTQEQLTGVEVFLREAKAGYKTINDVTGNAWAAMPINRSDIDYQAMV